MTPFEEAGYTKETKFIVTREGAEDSLFREGDIVWLMGDDGSEMPLFTDGETDGWMELPCTGELDLEVYEEDK